MSRTAAALAARGLKKGDRLALLSHNCWQFVVLSFATAQVRAMPLYHCAQLDWVGEIVHRSPHATLGYYKDAAMTAAAFRNGWFHSGDLGVMTPDGYLTVVDRKKDMIKTGGENVASREVEEAIYQMPGVAEVAVFGVAHPRWVEAVVAVVVPKPGATLTEEAVITHTRGLLAGYKTPKRVVIAGTVPKNPSGKILKRQLREEHNNLAAQV